MADQPPLPLTPPIRCLQCDGRGDVYYIESRPEVVGGKRRACPGCGGTGVDRIGVSLRPECGDKPSRPGTVGRS
jgi:DnaJ-class molecular chaperone